MSDDIDPLNFPPSYFSPTAAEKYRKLEDNQALKLVHYTSAWSASEIIRSRRFWLRNARMMNDYDELVTGARWLSEFWQTPSALLSRFLAAIHLRGAKVAAAVQNACFSPLNEIILESYIGCFSIHDTSDAKSDLGRLSMWRGYGAGEAVAFVLNTDRFLAADSPYNVFSYPVLYGDRNEFLRLIDEYVTNLEALGKALSKLQDDDFIHVFRLFVEQMVLGFKHPGFFEEQEWRVVYRPHDQPSEHLERKIVEITGSVQAIYTLPLENRVAKQDASFEISDLVHKIIVGPCPNQIYLQRLFSDLLQGAGLKDAEKRIVCSGIPFR